MKEIKISDIVALLKDGYTRWEKDATEAGKSIQTKFDLSFSECKSIFAHPKIKGLKTKIQSVKLIDDDATPATTPVAPSQTVAKVEVVKPSPATIEDQIENLFK